ncbi:hypothetical protein ACFS07_20035 [Undibacterium arcticum]
MLEDGAVFSNTAPFFLAHVYRLGLLPEGYIYPVEERGLRDLSRKRLQLVQQRTQNIFEYRKLDGTASGNTASERSDLQIRRCRGRTARIGDARSIMTKARDH